MRTHADMRRTCKLHTDKRDREILPHPIQKFDVVDPLAPAMGYTYDNIAEEKVSSV